MPRLTLAKQQAKIRQLERSLKDVGELHAKTHKRLVEDAETLRKALKDAVALIDLMRQRAGKRPLPLLDGEEVRKLDAARFLSLAV